MTEKLRVLIIEDSEDDALLIINEIKEGGYDPKFERVETREAFLSALKKGGWDIIISDYSMPKFSGLDAVKLLKESGIDLPFILVSGTIGEEIAVKSLLSGAHDFIVKGKWDRFVPAIKRELKDAKVRQEQKLGEEKLKESEEKYRSLFVHMMNGFVYSRILVDENNQPVDFEYITVNEAYEKITGLKEEEIIGKKFSEVVPDIKDIHPELIDTYGKVALTGEEADFTLFVKPSQKWLHIFVYCPQKGYFAAVLHDITEQKLAEKNAKEKQSLNELLLNSLPHPSMIINRDRVILAANRIALEVGAEVGKYCWESFGQSRSIPEQDKKYIEQHKKIPEGGTHCIFCLAEEAFSKQKSVNIDIEIEEKVFDTYWVPIDQEKYLHYAIDITERKEIEKKIIESRKLLAKSQEIAHMGHWVMDVDSRKLYWSDEAYNIFGLQPEQVDPNFEKFLEIVHPDDREMLVKKTAIALESDDHPYKYEFRITRDGVERYLYEEAEVERDSSGKPLRMVGISQDITERKLAEKAVRGSEEKLRNITSSAMDAIIMIDNGGKVTYWNPAAEKIFGFSQEDIIGKELHNFIIPEKYREKHVKGLAEFKKKGHGSLIGKTVESEGLRKNGEKFPVEISLSSVKVGDQWHAIGIVRNITERKRLEEMETRFGRILESSLNEIYIFDAETLRFIQVNTGARKNLGYSMEELHHLTAFDLKPEFTAETFAELIQPLRKKQTKIVKFMTIHRRKDGSLYPVEVHLQLAPFGSLSVFIAIILDITERKKAEEALQKSEEQLRHAQKLEAVGTLAGGVAHDFNNMLTSIIGYTEITMDDLGEENSNYGNLKQVLNASFRAKDIVAQLMSYSRKTKEDKMPLQIDKIIHDTLKLLGTSLPTSISIKKEIEQDIEIIMGNATQIQQILMNLCINAGHAMPEGGTLKVALKNLALDKFEVVPGQEISGTYVLMSVEDNGIGMDKATVERIFDPFFTTKEVGKGTGLGLSTVYGIVKQHDGYIMVDSEKGKGTVFNVYLPAIKQDTKTKPVKTGKQSNLFEDKERRLDSFEVKTTEEEIIINIPGNASISRTEKDKLLELYVLSRSEKKKILVNCSSAVQQSLKEDGFDKFLEIKVKE